MGPGEWISHGGRRKGTEPIQNRGKGLRGRHQEGRARTVPPHLASPQGPADGTCHQENAGDVLWASLGPREAGVAGGEPESPNDCASSHGCPDRNLRSGSFPKGAPICDRQGGAAPPGARPVTMLRPPLSPFSCKQTEVWSKKLAQGHSDMGSYCNQACPGWSHSSESWPIRPHEEA